MADDSETEFEEELAVFLSSFHLQTNLLTRNRLKDIRKTLLLKSQKRFVILEEETRLFNLISYLAFLDDEVEIALHHNARVLSVQKNDGIALANRIRFNRRSGNFFDSRKDFETLKHVYSSSEGCSIRFNAKCQLAWSYARLGPRYNKISISKFEELAEETRFLSDANAHFMWQYEYGLCLKRALHLENRVEHPEMDEFATIKAACQIFVDVATNAPNKTYRARAWANLGALAFSIESRPLTFGIGIENYISVHQSGRSCKVYFRVAMSLDENDFDVLELCAKYNRHLGKLEQAINLFERALKVGESSLAYHHLALSLKKLEQEKCHSYSVSRRNQNADEYLTENTSFTKLINSPRRAFVLQRNKEIEEVLCLLEKAIEIDPGNKFALRDKAFTYRQLQNLEEAKDIFCRLANSLEVCELKITCYEQAGYCCLDLAAEKYGQNKHRYEHDAICNLKKAIEVAATLAAKVSSSSTEFRQLLPTVSEMLLDPGLIEAHNKE